jgi:hypothetical protein
MTDDALTAALAATIDTARTAERDLFGSLDPAARDRPIRPGDWSPKDFQAHLSAWKGRHAVRLARLRGSQEPADADAESEEDAINARLRATRVDWAWDAITDEADEAAARLVAEIRQADPEEFRASDRLINLTFGNGLIHTLTHVRWLLEAGVPLDGARVAAFERDALRVAGVAAVPEHPRAAEIYNIACHHALRGSLDLARGLLRDSFRLDPGLVEFSRTDEDLVAIRGELEDLAG